MIRSCRFILAAFLFLQVLFPASVLYALHEVDHRFTVEGRVCGDDGEGIKEVFVSVKNTRAEISGTGKTDGDGFYSVKLHLHNENQGDPLVIQAGDYESTGKVELDPNDVKTERVVSINLGRPCRAIPFWRQTWTIIAGLTVGTVMAIWFFRKITSPKAKKSQGSKRPKGKKK